MMTIADVQRQNREAVQQRKRKAIRIASSFAIGLHVVGIIFGAVYFIHRTVLEKNDDKLESVLVEDSKPKQHESRNHQNFLNSKPLKGKLSRRVLKSRWATHGSHCRRMMYRPVL